MTVPAHDPMTKEAFLAWVERCEERYEFSDGRVIKLMRVTRNQSPILIAEVLSPGTHEDICRGIT